jgi:hypothetical protein
MLLGQDRLADIPAVHNDANSGLRVPLMAQNGCGNIWGRNQISRRRLHVPPDQQWVLFQRLRHFPEMFGWGRRRSRRSRWVVAGSGYCLWVVSPSPCSAPGWLSPSP